VLLLAHEWLHHYCKITQIHGVKWYALAPNMLFRIFFLAFFSTFIVALPIYFVNEGQNAGAREKINEY
jgi:steroid 5-alpha reductase family enzyme